MHLQKYIDIYVAKPTTKNCVHGKKQEGSFCSDYQLEIPQLCNSNNISIYDIRQICSITVDLEVFVKIHYIFLLFDQLW